MTSPNSNVNSSSAATTPHDKSSKQPWRPAFATSCYSAEDKTILWKLSLCRTLRSTELSSKNIGLILSLQRILFSDWSRSSSTRINEDLALNFGAELHDFQLSELRGITLNFSSNYLLGEGGFGTVHKGYVDENLRQGLKPQSVAVKLLDIEGLQGHREWLVNAQAFQAHLLPPEVIDRGLQELANGCPNLRKVALVGATELGLLSLAEECSTLQDLELHKCNDNICFNFTYNVEYFA
ncbi:hypothetical protein F8388_011278 [Cannabis sativa]|uniref:Protein kinase domain-containing protein n=1 Tax=Cannabis sativa TaxID=3483 RepID=A0A7J6GNJ2_CANSA|nr:hypothetical protein F8388_011278 [Cannabis sativa]KAF4384494.1 hypothetical protein G4B88_007131 [Cannabis sativa]